jgi:hypothetical protein
MWDMAKNSISLFFAGKLFADPAKVYLQISIGIAVTAVVLIALTFAGMALWLAALLAGLAGGALQPYLFKDLKYR